MKKGFRSIYKIARENADMTQESASALLGICTRWLGEYESGRTPVPDAIVCKMAEIYDAPWLAYQHLKQETEIGRKFLPDIDILDIARAVLKFKKEIRDLETVDGDMVEIACDGMIDETEKPKWQKVEKEVDEVIGAALAILFSKREKEKALMARAI